MILGLHGYKQSGKDTIADYLVQNYGFTKLSFADKMKEAVCALFDISREQLERWKVDPDVGVSIVSDNWINIESISFRVILQRFGTEMGRNVFGQDFWIDMCLSQVNHHDDFVISDVRFENELQAITQWDSGVNAHVLRPGTKSDGHASEQSFPRLCKIAIHNDGDLDNLYREVDKLMKVYGR